MHILATSRQYLIVPAGLLAARPLLDAVDLAVIADDGSEPADGDWLPASWLKAADGSVLGPGLLAGPGAQVYAAGEYVAFVREHLPDGEVPVWAWTRLTIGAAA